MFSLSFVSRYFLISSLISSLIFWLFSKVLFNLHVLGFFPDFFHVLISSLIALWSEMILDMILIFLNLPKLDL